MKKILWLLGGILLGGGFFYFFIIRPLPSGFFKMPTSLSPRRSPDEIGTKAGTLSLEPPYFSLQLPVGFQIGVFANLSADGLGAPRDLEFSPNGTLLVSIPSQGKVIVLPDRNKDGKTDEMKTAVSGLTRPHGLAFFNRKLYIAEETRVSRFDFNEENLTATFDKELFTLPKGSNHVTRSLVFNKKGQLFVTIGSTCNVCVEDHEWYASIIISDSEGNNPRLFAKGLRNSVFLTINPQTNQLWAADMGRDLLGDNTPAEEINIIQEGRNYGWPYCYENRVHDDNFDPKKEHSCGMTEPPIFMFQAHSAPLGLTFINSKKFPESWQGDLLVSYHGSWNRSILTGYKVVRMHVEGNSITNMEDFLTGFIQNNQVLGRPVDVIFNNEGSLFISDDKAGIVYIIP